MQERTVTNDQTQEASSDRSHAQLATRTRESLAVGLALIAGYIDAYGILALGAYLSFMSGNTTQTGIAMGQAKFAAAVPTALAIVSFLTGCFTGTWIAHSHTQQANRSLFGLVACMLAIIVGVTEFGSLPRAADIATLALARG
jgi:uncharacterized membrane protein YoaK (UPF0700 family)